MDETRKTSVFLVFIKSLFFSSNCTNCFSFHRIELNGLFAASGNTGDADDADPGFSGSRDDLIVR